MKKGISSIPKHCLLILLSDMLELVHTTGSTVISESLLNKEKVRTLTELFLSKNTALLLMAANKTIEMINEDDGELNNIIAEMKLHMDTYRETYQDMFSEMANAEIDTILDKLGLYRGLSGDTDD